MIKVSFQATQGEPLDRVASVASLFVSRIDTVADMQLAADSPLRGTIATASARRAYRLYQQRFSSPRWQRLADRGARKQRPLWASTGIKEAFDDHGDPRLRPLGDRAEVDAGVEVLSAAGIDLDRITDDLERDGVAKFARSYTELTACTEDKLQALTR